VLWKDLSRDSKSILEWLENPVTGEKLNLVVEKDKDWEITCPDGNISVPVTSEIFNEIKEYVMENDDITLVSKTIKMLEFKIKDRIIYLDDIITTRSLVIDGGRELKVGQEIELYELAGGHVVAKVISVTKFSCYAQTIRHEPSL
jgi:hypothetical protein